MDYKTFVVSHIWKEREDTFRLTLTPKDNQLFDFLPGQYVYLKNPKYKPHEEHPFSIASSPRSKNHLEFCIRVHGDWTQEIEKIKKRDILDVSHPQGSFTWNNSISHVVFLVGGLGISPIMSILRTIEKTQRPKQMILLYGNQTPETVAFEDELKSLSHTLSELNVVHVFSHLPVNHPWQGYRGFITEEILEKEVDLSINPDFFIIGPPVFLEKMHTLLHSLHVPFSKIHTENLS